MGCYIYHSQSYNSTLHPMIKELWISLPVKDLALSKEFFKRLGFTFHLRHETDNSMAGLVMGSKGLMVMLVPVATFETFARYNASDTGAGTEMLLSFEMDSRAEVDAMYSLVVAAGGTIFAEPEDQGWMYGFGFADPDWHRWNVLWSDISAMPG